MVTSDLLDETEAAAFISLERTTLRFWRCRRPWMLPYHKIAGRVRYRRADLVRFIAKGRVDVKPPSGDPAPRKRRRLRSE